MVALADLLSLLAGNSSWHGVAVGGERLSLFEFALRWARLLLGQLGWAIRCIGDRMRICGNSLATSNGGSSVGFRTG
jgi:hypothetical protein